MRLVNQTIARRMMAAALGVGIIGVGGAGIAQAADLNTRVAGSSCTVAQAENTLKAQNPAIYTKIMKYHDSADGLADVMALSSAARADVWSQSHPVDADNRQLFLGVHGWSKDERHAAEAAIDKAATTCRA